MSPSKHFQELSEFIREHEPEIADEERGARIGGGSEAGARTPRRKGGEEAARTGKGNGRGVASQIEADQEAAGLVRKGQSGQISHDLVAAPDVNMLEMLAEQQGMRYIDLGHEQIDPEAVKLFPADFARDNRCLPIKIEEDGTLVVAIADPLNVTIADNLRLLLEREIEPVVANEDDIADLIDTHFSHAEDIDVLMEELQTEAGISSPTTATEFSLDPEQAAHSAPVIRLVNLILMRALKDRASDLHIEPFANTLRIRYRVDGVLRELPPPPKSFQVGLLSRFKVMANMNIAETRRPQDGRIKLTTQGREVDLRVSSLPTVHGESIVMRVLDKQMMMIGIDQIGMTKKILEEFRKVCKRPNGVVLVTGPTGCGKTTTLYAAITDRLNTEEKFITTEDPVEYEVPGLVQVNINSNVGLTFAACLRAILRQDPDIILVGEIRDQETATISIQAALTGHLVFSTLHTNSAAATITRMVDMGIEPFLLTSTLQVVIGQRLVRSICQICRETYQPTPEELREFGLRDEEVQDITFYHGAGCEECNYTGYRGRLGLFEMMRIDDEIRDLILERATSDEIHELAVNRGMMTMRQDAFLKVCMGITTFSEASHHLTPEPDELIRKEIQPILKQLRVKLGMTDEEKAHLEKPADRRPSSVEDEEIEALLASASQDTSRGRAETKEEEGAPDFGELPEMPEFHLPMTTGEEATAVSAEEAEEDEFSFLSAGSLEDQTPLAAPDLGDLGALEEAGSEEEELGELKLPELDADEKNA